MMKVYQKVNQLNDRPLENRAVTKRILSMTFLVLLLLFGVRTYLSFSDDFRLSHITHEMPYQMKWEIPPPTVSEEAELSSILQQEYYYLGKGSQCYVFSSKDDQYVLKFFKFKHITPGWKECLLPAVGPFKNYLKQQAARKARKLYGVFDAYQLAYRLNRQSSGLKFIQLNSKNNFPRIVSAIDKIGFTHIIHLENMPFIIQRKADPLSSIMHQLLKKGDLNIAKLRLRQVFELYAAEYAQGLLDRDHHVMRNVGFIGNEPIHFDIGKLVKEEKMQLRHRALEDAHLIAKAINAWVLRHYPQHHPSLYEYIDALMNVMYSSDPDCALMLST